MSKKANEIQKILNPIKINTHTYASPSAQSFGIGKMNVICQYVTNQITKVANGSYSKFANIFLAKTLKRLIHQGFIPPKVCAIVYTCSHIGYINVRGNPWCCTCAYNDCMIICLLSDYTRSISLTILITTEISAGYNDLY